jgi:hypothetical protein
MPILAPGRLSRPIRRRAIAAAALPALLAAGCGSTVSTSNYKGEQHAVAQTIANLQADATAGEQHKICANDLAAPAVARLGGQAGCERAVKSQLSEIDNFEVNIDAITLGPKGDTATATVKSTYGGNKRTTTMQLVKEGGTWKVAAFG